LTLPAPRALYSIMPIEVMTTEPAPRDLTRSLVRGWNGRCPHCGDGRVFSAFLKVSDHCPTCREELHHHRADDAPPYFTIFVVGHIVVAGVLAVEQAWRPDMWIHAALWTPLTLVLSLLLLPRFKGAMVGLQWALRMHGFGGPDSVEAPSAPGPTT
jgi:uncharacterized protein (DUF983 family)